MNEVDFINNLKEHGYLLSERQIELLFKYLMLIEEGNKVMDLTANVSKEEILEKNFYDSILSASNFDYNDKSLIDVGSGAGFPGMLYAIVFEKLNVTLLEPLKKRAVFLADVVNKLGLTNVNVVSERCEDYCQNQREQFDYASARGVAKLNILLELIIPLLKVGGIFIALKGKMAFEEEDLAKNALNIMHTKRLSFEEFNLPTGQEKRINLYYIKNKETEKKYPRNFGQIKKKPL